MTATEAQWSKCLHNTVKLKILPEKLIKLDEKNI